MSEFLISVEGVRKAYSGVEVLHGVDLEVRGGSVLALLGENGAGKSTLMKILAGDRPPDHGRLVIDGDAYTSLTPAQSRAAGIRMIHQELAGAPSLSVAENISLGVWPRRRGLVDRQAMARRARTVLNDLGAELDVDAPIESLRLGERQIVEIARAVSANARCLILDEPTAALSHHESERLFAHLDRAKQRKVAIVYITHRLEEVQRLSDRVLVLRDGVVALDQDTRRVDRRDLVSAMIGRDTGEVRRPEAVTSSAPPSLEYVDATSAGRFDSVRLQVRPGEVICLYGKVGAGAEDVLQAAFGALPLSSGRMLLLGMPYEPGSPRNAIDAGVGSLSSDRKRDALFAVRSVAENLCAPSWRRLSNGIGMLSRRSESRAFAHWKPRLSIRMTGDARQPIEALSGGNQQKVLLARWLEQKSKVLLLAEPTRGVDVGARDEIYSALREIASRGLAVLVATSDYEEVVQLADRAYVMARGRVTSEFEAGQITIRRLTEAAGE